LYTVEVMAFRKAISVKEIETIIVKHKIILYLKFLEPFVSNLRDAIGFDLIEKHSVLENEIKDLLQSIKLFKKDFFSVAEKLI
jgi:hypothetical protein